ncbi:DEAD/DEAH box helicase family protein [Enterovibrio norvegicus]|uniref:DEAD/DEAH box helicase family protein n=1 Tax=Enterovibrio norvegicus TaxID=188144 RepID=UPI0024B0CAF9|nr:DEAD/DEAH box helicase family protein [Enterovibrio norvegicus]
MTTLRAWQEDCAYLALNQYLDGEKHFLCLATPGAGKSIMAAEVASRLLDENLIDFVLCFSPSREVASGLKKTFQFSLKNRFDGYFGSLGDSLTYQAMINLDESFWLLLKHSRVLVWRSAMRTGGERLSWRTSKHRPRIHSLSLARLGALILSQYL